MAREADKFKIGLFVIITLILAVGLITWMGASKFFETYDFYVTYFDESISGLDIGSGVALRGVPVGTVSAIAIAPDEKLIEIQLKIRAGQNIPENYYALLELKGITGLRTININQIRRSEMLEPPELSFEPKLPVINSYPSGSVQLDVALNRIYESVLNVDTKSISEGLVRLLSSIDTMVNNSPVNNILARMESQSSQSLKNLDEVLNKLEQFNIEETNARMITVLDKYGDVADSMKIFIPQMTASMRGLQFLLQTTQRDLSVGLQQMSESMRSAKRLVDFIESNPAALIRGRNIDIPKEK